ncbi:MAG: DUF2946 family protein [Limnohabitans sp.]
MTTLQSLRNARWLTRLVLVWLALFIGAAVASPLIKPPSAQMVCSAMGGMKMVVGDDTGERQTSPSGMDCPLCAQICGPVPTMALAVVAPSALAHALRPMASAHIAWLTGSPLPPRGPPAFS